MLCTSPLATLLVGYFHRWLLSDEEATPRISNFVPIGNAYRAAGLAWLAAEAAGLAGETTLKSAATQAEKHQQMHARLGTISLINLIEPEPVWQRSLSAIAQLGESRPPTDVAAQPAAPSERIIWELNTDYDSFELQPFVQKRSADGWTTGRRVGLQRLYTAWNSPEFAFSDGPGSGGVPSAGDVVPAELLRLQRNVFSFNELRAARALVGHPCVFRPGRTRLAAGDRPAATATGGGPAGRPPIRLKLDPTPEKDPWGEERPFCLIKDGPRRIVFVFFQEQHRKLYKVLGKMLDVPAAAAERVLASIQKVSSLVAVHSEIGGDLPTAESVAGDTRPHVHLLPFQGGLRAEFFVRPFGDDGPFCRPGQGGANVFASLNGQPKTARRDLLEEQQQLGCLLAACPALAVQVQDDAAEFPSPIEALEALLQLEDQVAEERVLLHWPQGQSLRLAGRASAAQFHVQVRQDRDWFAASGTLKVDRSLTVDMMKLIELVESSPSRFVKLDDGRFLALTEQLRRRVEELAAYGDRRGSKLRFPPVRAAALEDLGDSIKLKADASWTRCVQRMRQAGEVRAEVPTTLQAELRDYQRDGFQWMARLAEWGVGGCLADDMGLGKTIEALALLVHRAAGGPALVVAPTSVGFNWLNETNRFAPTLNARLFGPGDRDAFFKTLGPRDVVICSYGLLHTEAARFQSQPWHTVILDEAQSIKNMATRRSQAAMGLTADFRLIMTGTPLENHLGELWNLFQFINPGLLGSLEHFQQRFAAPIERDGCHETRRRLKKLIQPFLLRRTKTQVLAELPPRIELTLQVELSDEEAAFYEALRQRLGKTRRVGRWSSAAIEDSGRNHAVAAGLLSSEARAGRCRHFQFEAGPVLGNDRRTAGQPPQGAGLQPVRRPPDDSPRRTRPERCFIPVSGRQHACIAAETAGRGLPGRRRRRVSDQPQSGRPRSEPDGGRLCAAHGPLVEPGGRRSGLRPRSPPGPAAPRDDLPLHHQRHHRTAHHGPACHQARPGRRPARRRRPQRQTHRRTTAPTDSGVDGPTDERNDKIWGARSPVLVLPCQAPISRRHFP